MVQIRSLIRRSWVRIPAPSPISPSRPPTAGRDLVFVCRRAFAMRRRRSPAVVRTRWHSIGVFSRSNVSPSVSPSLSMLSAAGLSYASPTQKARVITELWAGTRLYCAACPSDAVAQTPNNNAAFDFVCPVCEATYQLKSQCKPIRDRIVDAAYGTMMKHIECGRAPNLWVMQYELPGWSVSNLLLVPSFAFSASSVEPRKPLGSTARRAGWVGCNIVLRNIPVDARIDLVTRGQWQKKDDVRASFSRMRAVATGDAEARGWTLDVLAVVRTIGRDDFSIDDVYAHEAILQRLHPNNRHVRAKIRQQLQILRDNGFIAFTAPGQYRVVSG